MRKLDLIKETTSSGNAWASRGLKIAFDGRKGSFPVTGSTTLDLSGNSSNGTITGGVTHDPDGSFKFNGTSGFITTAISSGLFSGGEASITMYLKLDNATPSFLQTGLIGYSNTSSNIRTHYPFTDGKGYLETFRAARVGPITLSPLVNRANYHQVTITTNSSGDWKLYQNNILVTSVTAEGSVAFNYQFIGKSAKPNGSDVFYFDGNIMSFFLNNVELTPAEIAENLNYNLNPLSSSTGTSVTSLDLLEGEHISVTRYGINIDNISELIGGKTNQFNLPFTPINNKEFDLLELEGNDSNTPYTDNYVRYVEDGIELIPKGRLNLKGIKDTYVTTVTHGINDFFDKIRGKYMRDVYADGTAWAPTVLNGGAIANTNTIIYTGSVITIDNFKDNGIIIPLTDTSGITPVKTWEQIPHFGVEFGLEKLCEQIGYEFINNTLINFYEWVFSGERGVDSTDIETNYTGLIEQEEDDTYTFATYTAEKKGDAIIDFDYTVAMVTGTFGMSSPRVYINGISVWSGTCAGSVGTYSQTTSSIPIEKGDLIELNFDYCGGATSGAKWSIDFDSTYTQAGNVFIDFDFVIGDLTQTDFLRDTMKLFNLGCEVDSLRKTFTLISNNNSQGIEDNAYSDKIDLSKYFSRVVEKKFNSNFGQINNCSYKYQENDVNFADGVIKANNVNKDKNLIESIFTASSNFLSCDLDGKTYQLTTIKNAFEDSGKSNNIGYRLNKITRFENISPDTLTFQDFGSPSTYTVSNYVSVLSFKGLDFNTLISKHYPNLQNHILNKYQEYTVEMKTPKVINRNFKIEKDRLIIDKLGMFKVVSITTKPSGLSEWKIIKINAN